MFGSDSWVQLHLCGQQGACCSSIEMRNFDRDAHRGYQVNANQPCYGMRFDTRSLEGQPVELEHFGPDGINLRVLVVYMHEGSYLQCKGEYPSVGIELPALDGSRRMLLDCRIVLLIEAA